MSIALTPGFGSSRVTHQQNDGMTPLVFFNQGFDYFHGVTPQFKPIFYVGRPTARVLRRTRSRTIEHTSCSGFVLGGWL